MMAAFPKISFHSRQGLFENLVFPAFIIASCIDYLDRDLFPYLGAIWFLLFFIYWFIPFKTKVFLSIACLQLVVDCWYFFPDMSNHGILRTQMNLGFILCYGLVYFFKNAEQSANQQFQEIISLRWPQMLGIVYLWAGFHKINSDYFSTTHGCSEEFLVRIAKLFGLISIEYTWLILLFGLLSIIIELFLGIALLSNRFRRIGAFVAILFHTPLSLIGFADFSSLAYAILLMVIGTNILTQEKLQDSDDKKFNQVLWVYFGVISLGLILVSLHWHLIELPLSPFYLMGFSLSIAVLPVYLFFLRIGKVKPDDIDLPPLQKKVTLLLPLLIAVWGLQPYLGLRNAGVYSMFSNLYILESKTNHLILQNNPLKFFNLSDPDIEILEIIAEDGAKIHLHPPGFKFPKSEFKKNMRNFAKKFDQNFTVTFQQKEQTLKIGFDTQEWSQYFGTVGLIERTMEFRGDNPSDPIRECRW